MEGQIVCAEKDKRKNQRMMEEERKSIISKHGKRKESGRECQDDSNGREVQELRRGE